jgi:conjugative transfer signal peptidase TraF
MAAGVLGATSGILLWLTLQPTVGLFFNGTVSLPMGIYHVRDGPVRVGDVVATCLNEEASALALARGYLGEGNCSHGTGPVGKVLAAIAGDTVTVTSAGVWIGAHQLPNSVPLERDRHGYSLPEIRGSFILRAGEAWLYSGYDPRSFDSRYFGPVSASAIRGRAVPLWIWQESYDARRDLPWADGRRRPLG